MFLCFISCLLVNHPLHPSSISNGSMRAPWPLPHQLLCECLSTKGVINAPDLSVYSCCFGWREERGLVGCKHSLSWTRMDGSLLALTDSLPVGSNRCPTEPRFVKWQDLLTAKWCRLEGEQESCCLYYSEIVPPLMSTPFGYLAHSLFSMSWIFKAWCWHRSERPLRDLYCFPKSSDWHGTWSAQFYRHQAAKKNDR